MKKIVFTIALILSLGLNSNVWAEGNKVNEVNGTNNTTNTTVRTIKTPWFARPLVEKWIKEYAKTQPGVEFQIAKDPLGVSFNALPNIFDLESRHIKDNLSLVGLDVKKDLAESFSDNGTLDDLLTALENSKVSEVAIEKVGISVNNADDEVNKFLDWVLAQGTKYNHEFGLLNLK